MTIFILLLIDRILSKLRLRQIENHGCHGKESNFKEEKEWQKLQNVHIRKTCKLIKIKLLTFSFKIGFKSILA